MEFLIKHAIEDVYATVKKHWLLFLVLVLLVFLLPPFLFCVAYLAGKLVQGIGKYFGEQAGKAAAKIIQSVVNLIEAEPYIFVAIITLIFPLLGWLLLLWNWFDKLKPRPTATAITPTSTPVNLPVANPDPATAFFE